MEKYLLIVSMQYIKSFGTGKRGMESKINRQNGISYKADWEGIKAQPYMYPAYKKAEKYIKKKFKRKLQEKFKGS